MKKTMRMIAGTISMLFVLATVAQALPIIPMNTVSEWKLANFETVIDHDQSGTITDGDTIFGIMKITSIAEQGQSGVTWTSDSGLGELTGAFQLTVANTVNPLPLDPLVPTATDSSFNLTLVGTDHFSLYFDVIENWNETYASAVDGSLWAQVTAGTLFESEATKVPNVFQSQNTTYANLTTNNTGYTFVPNFWPETSILGTTAPDFLPIGFFSEIYMESKLTPLTPQLDSTTPFGDLFYQFRSQDPINVYATPEPSTLILLGLGLVGAVGYTRRKKQA